MIKRRFFRLEHADRDDASGTSSSSSDSEIEGESSEEIEADDDDDVPEVIRHQESHSSSSGSESEEISGNEVEADSSDDIQSGDNGQDIMANYSYDQNNSRAMHPGPEKDVVSLDRAYILKSKSVFKCRLCPGIICLTEESLNSHLKSKRHARSLKLLNDGRLTLMLNSDGEIEEDGETHAERLARTAAVAQNSTKSKKKNKGRQRQRTRLKKKAMQKKADDSKVAEAPPNMDAPPKKRLKGKSQCSFQ